MSEKITNASQGITIWAENVSGSYNPTGEDGFWTFMIIRPLYLFNYSYAIAYMQGRNKIHIYSNYTKVWYEISGN